MGGEPVFASVLDPVLRPLLSLPPFLTVFIMAFLITLGITFVYKFATDQERMKELRKKVKESQEKMKALRDNPEKMMKVQQDSMAVNMELMKHSFKPTLYTFIPIILIFGWMNANLAYLPLTPGQHFMLSATFDQGVSEATLSVIPEGIEFGNATQAVEDGAAEWVLSGPAGTYKATIDAGGKEGSVGTVEKQFLISDERRYEPPQQTYTGQGVTSITLGNVAVKPLGDLSLFGWHPGWLGTYIMLSIVLSILLRKLLGVV